jgi:hypothetical protein
MSSSFPTRVMSQPRQKLRCIVACGVSLANAQDLGQWMGAHFHLIFNFSPRYSPSVAPRRLRTDISKNDGSMSSLVHVVWPYLPSISLVWLWMGLNRLAIPRIGCESLVEPSMEGGRLVPPSMVFKRVSRSI